MLRSAAILAGVMWGGGAWAETLVVVGEDEGLAGRIAGEGRTIVAPAEARRLLVARLPEGSGDLPRARALADEGRSAYADADFGRAVERLEQSVQALIAAGVRRAAPELAAVQLDLGIARLAARQEREAAREIALALSIAPDARPDPAVHGPPAQRFVERVRDELVQAPTIARRIETSPPGATIEIDGRVAGTSPLEVRDLRAGLHVAEARLPGASLAVRFDATAEDAAPLSLDLPAPDPARGALESLEAGAISDAAAWARAALDADVAIAVARRGGALVAVRAPRSGPRETFRGGTAGEIARALYPTAVARVAVARPPRRHVSRTRPGSGGIPWWVWAGGAAVLAAGAATTFLVVRDTGEPGTTLVPVMDPAPSR